MNFEKIPFYIKDKKTGKIRNVMAPYQANGYAGLSCIVSKESRKESYYWEFRDKPESVMTKEWITGNFDLFVEPVNTDKYNPQLDSSTKLART